MKKQIDAHAPRRGLRRHEAANYLGVSPSLFDQLIVENKMPKPIKLRACSVWDVHELDVSFDAMKANDNEVNPWAGAVIR